MLKEMENTRQDSLSGRRKRWFTSPQIDLFVWEGDQGEIVSYQLTYDKPGNERALTWSSEHGFSHMGVNEGSRPGKYPASPMFVSDGVMDPDAVIALLKEQSGELDAGILQFIVTGIEMYFEI